MMLIMPVPRLPLTLLVVLVVVSVVLGAQLRVVDDDVDALGGDRSGVVAADAGVSLVPLPFDSMTGFTTSIVASYPIARAAAESMLAAYDSSLEIAYDDARAFGFDDDATTPVSLMANNMTHLRTHPHDVTFGGCEQYYELIVMLPFVRARANTTLRGGTSMQLYLNNEAAVLGGRLFYGMPKTLERAAWRRAATHNSTSTAATDSFVVRRELDASSVLANVNATVERAAAVDFAAFARNMSLWTATFERPIIQRSPNPLASSGSHLCSTMTMAWPQAYGFAPATLELSSLVVAGLPASASAASVPAVGASLPNVGAFFFEHVPWTLSAPWQSC